MFVRLHYICKPLFQKKNFVASSLTPNMSNLFLTHLQRQGFFFMCYLMIERKHNFILFSDQRSSI